MMYRKSISYIFPAILIVSMTCLIAQAQHKTSTPATKPSHDLTQRKLRVVVFGDSITGHRPGIAYQKHYLKYSDLLGIMIQGKLGVDTVEMINSGWAGDKTTPKNNEGWPGGRARLQKDLIDHKPDFAVFLFGGNNKPDSDEKRKQLYDDLTAMIQKIKAAGIAVLMLQYHPAMPTAAHHDKGWYHLGKLSNPIIARVAKENNIPLLDMAPAMTAAAKQYGRDAIVNEKDGVHLKPLGEVIFAKAIFQKLLKLGWLKLPSNT